MVTGQGLISDGTSSITDDEITDGLSHTILLVEVRNSDIHWSEPRDLDISAIELGINNDSTDQLHLGSRHPGVVVISLADGSVRSFPEDLRLETLRIMLTPNAGDLLKLE